MKAESDGQLVEFLDYLTKTKIVDKRQVRFSRINVLKEISRFLEETRNVGDSLLVFESWEPNLRNALLVSEYSFQFNPYTEESSCSMGSLLEQY